MNPYASSTLFYCALAISLVLFLAWTIRDGLKTGRFYPRASNAVRRSKAPRQFYFGIGYLSCLAVALLLGAFFLAGRYFGFWTGP